MAPLKREDFERLTEREMLAQIWGCMQQTNDQTASVLTTQKQIIMALLTIVAGNVVLKFIGTPPWIILALYTSALAGAFSIRTVIWFWRNLNWPRRLLRLAFGSFLWYSVISRAFFFKSQAPEWYQIGVDFGLTFISLFLIWSAWQSDGDAKNGSPSDKTSY